MRLSAATELLLIFGMELSTEWAMTRITESGLPAAPAPANEMSAFGPHV